MNMNEPVEPGVGSEHINNLREKQELLVPAEYQRPWYSAEEVLEIAGLSPEQYVVREDVECWSSRTGGAYEDRGDIKEEPIKYYAKVARQNEKGIWELGRLAVKHGGQSLLESSWATFQSGLYTACANPAVTEMGLNEKAIRDELDRREEVAKKIYSDKVEKWATTVKSVPYFSCLDLEAQKIIEELLSEENEELVYIPQRERMSSWISEAEMLYGRREKGEILVNFSAWHRLNGVTNCGNGWVIQPDGSICEPSVKNVPSYKHDGTYHWRIVESEELALRWRCRTTRDIAGSSSFEVAKMPASGLTPAQLEVVKGIEDEIKAPHNAFGLDLELQKVSELRMEAIRQACEKSRVLSLAPDDLKYLEVLGDWGQQVDTDLIVGHLDQFVDWDKEFSESCENRDAQLIDSQSAADGILEFLVYEKWGDINLNVRWRRVDEDEKGQDPTVNNATNDQGEATVGMLNALSEHFGKHK